MRSKKVILSIIILAQFLCTSLWFAGNAIVDDLSSSINLGTESVGNITIAVQLGFILGTLIFAIVALADRIPPATLFFACAILGAISNLLLLWDDISLFKIVSSRFMTGFFIAGIYPVGMKIAADYYKEGLGKSLGFLVGALVLGTASPHILNSFPSFSSVQFVVMSTSTLAVIGGLMMLLFVPNGPYRIPQQKFQLGALQSIFKNKKFNRAALGYFGHMWELYTFWAFIPGLLAMYKLKNPLIEFNSSLLSFSIIAVGTLGCVAAGYLSSYFGTKKIAITALATSGICCLVYPLAFQSNPTILISLLLIWGIAVIADSPLFSTMVANNAAAQLKGTALTIVNCIGFSVTIISLQCISLLAEILPTEYFLIPLVIGPIIGLVAMRKF